jgi:hypothetical protein
MKVRQPIGRQDSMQTMIRTSRRLDSFLQEAAQNFELLSNIQDQKLKIKNIAVDVLLKGYPMLPLSCRSIWPDSTFKPAQIFFNNTVGTFGMSKSAYRTK